MNIIQIRTFLPSKDFETSKNFYKDLGFTVTWENHELAEIGIAKQNFFLQKYYQEDWANNLMMQMFVDDLDELYSKAAPLIDKYEGTKIKSIFETDYGRTFHLIGPAGVLWHMTETENKNIKQDELLCNDEKKSTK